MTSPTLKLLLVLLLAIAIVGAVGAWSIPVEVVQNWAVSREGDDPYAAYEAAGQAEALWWLGRVAFPVLIAGIAWCLWRAERVRDSFQRVLSEFLDVTRAPAGISRFAGVGTGVFRILIVTWLLLAGVHVVRSIDARTREWAYFRLRSGDEVLPNISFENRAVIRYLREATPEDARILVLSDQSVFFLAYYLLPRTVLHPLHPEAEFAIPQPGEARPSYRLADLPGDYLARVKPDYVLEYFEGRDALDPARLKEDADWVAFWQRTSGEFGVPPFLVALRAVPKDMPR